MRKSMSLIISIICFGHLYAQNDDCVLNVYSGNNNIINVYSTYKLESTINLDSLAINKAELVQIINSLKDSLVVEIVEQFKKDSMFLEFHKKYLFTDCYEGLSYNDFLRYNNFQKATYTEEFYRRNVILDKNVGQYIQKYNLLNLSLYYYDSTETADIYIYEKGHKFKGIYEVNFKMMSNPLLYSVLGKHYEEVNLLDYKDDLIGFEESSFTQIVYVPIVVNSKYICDVRMVFCK